MFAALDDEDTSTLYYSFAFIYALPYLANGFQLDGFVLVSLVLCAVHVQVGLRGGQARWGRATGRALPCLSLAMRFSWLTRVCAGVDGTLHGAFAGGCISPASREHAWVGSGAVLLCQADSTHTSRGRAHLLAGAPALPRHPHLPHPACSFAVVQVERLAQTEPVEVELPSVLRSLLAGIPKAVRSLGRYRCVRGRGRRRGEGWEGKPRDGARLAKACLRLLPIS